MIAMSVGVFKCLKPPYLNVFLYLNVLFDIIELIDSRKAIYCENLSNRDQNFYSLDDPRNFMSCLD